MLFTGILGTVNSQLGQFELGSIGTTPETNSVSTFVTVTPSVGFDIEHHLYWVMSNSITVTPTIADFRDKAESVDDSITVTPTLVTISSTERVTQYAIDVVYTKAPSASITHNVTVTPAFHRYQRDVPITVSDSIHTTPTLAETGSSHFVLTDHVHVGQTCHGRNNIVRIGVTTSISCGTPSSGRDTHSRQTVTSTAHVTGTARPGINQLGIGIVDDITVTDRFSFYTNPLLISTGIVIAVTDTIGGGAPNRSILVIDDIHVATTVNPKRPTQSLADHIKVTKTEGGGTAHRTEVLTQPITVTSTPLPRSTADSQTFRTKINVVPTIGLRTPRITIEMADHVTVTSTGVFLGAKSQVVTQGISVTSSNAFYGPTQFVTSNVTVKGSIRSNLVDIPVSQAITVHPRLTNFDQFVHHKIHVTPTLRRDYFATFVDDLTPSESIVDPIRRGILVDRKSVV